MFVDNGKDNELRALISLIDDPDEMVYAEVFDKIVKEGSGILPLLESAYENSIRPEVQARISHLSHVIQLEMVADDLKKWVGSEMNLIEGAMIIARFQHPYLKEEDVHYEINRIRKDIWVELNENLTALEQIKVFNHVFYEMLGFKGNIENYHLPENSYINEVLETKTGNPLSLGIIYILLAQSLELPVYGVNLPEHFVLAYTARSIDPETLLVNDRNVLFYINAFSKGSIFSNREVEEFIAKLKLEPVPEYFNPCSNKDIILRMVNNLIIAYGKKGDKEKAKELEDLRTILE